MDAQICGDQNFQRLPCMSLTLWTLYQLITLCQGSTNSASDFLCQTLNDGLYPNPADCSSYLQCAGHKTHIKPCPKGLQFSPTIKTCGFTKATGCIQGVNSQQSYKQPQQQTVYQQQPLYQQQPQPQQVYQQPLQQHGPNQQPQPNYQNYQSHQPYVQTYMTLPLQFPGGTMSYHADQGKPLVHHNVHIPPFQHQPLGGGLGKVGNVWSRTNGGSGGQGQVVQGYPMNVGNFPPGFNPRYPDGGYHGVPPYTNTHPKQAGPNAYAGHSYNVMPQHTPVYTGSPQGQAGFVPGAGYNSGGVPLHVYSHGNGVAGKSVPYPSAGPGGFQHAHTHIHQPQLDQGTINEASDNAEKDSDLKLDDEVNVRDDPYKEIYRHIVHTPIVPFSNQKSENIIYFNDSYHINERNKESLQVYRDFAKKHNSKEGARHKYQINKINKKKDEISDRKLKVSLSKYKASPKTTNAVERLHRQYRDRLRKIKIKTLPQYRPATKTQKSNREVPSEYAFKLNKHQYKTNKYPDKTNKSPYKTDKYPHKTLPYRTYQNYKNRYPEDSYNYFDSNQGEQAPPTDYDEYDYPLYDMGKEIPKKTNKSERKVENTELSKIEFDAKLLSYNKHSRHSSTKKNTFTITSKVFQYFGNNSRKRGKRSVDSDTRDVEEDNNSTERQTEYSSHVSTMMKQNDQQMAPEYQYMGRELEQQNADQHPTYRVGQPDKNMQNNQQQYPNYQVEQTGEGMQQNQQQYPNYMVEQTGEGMQQIQQQYPGFVAEKTDEQMRKYPTDMEETIETVIVMPKMVRQPMEQDEMEPATQLAHYPSEVETTEQNGGYPPQQESAMNQAGIHMNMGMSQSYEEMDTHKMPPSQRSHEMFQKPSIEQVYKMPPSQSSHEMLQRPSSEQVYKMPPSQRSHEMVQRPSSEQDNIDPSRDMYEQSQPFQEMKLNMMNVKNTDRQAALKREQYEQIQQEKSSGNRYEVPAMVFSGVEQPHYQEAMPRKVDSGATDMEPPYIALGSTYQNLEDPNYPMGLKKMPKPVMERIQKITPIKHFLEKVLPKAMGPVMGVLQFQPNDNELYAGPVPIPGPDSVSTGGDYGSSAQNPYSPTSLNTHYPNYYTGDVHTGGGLGGDIGGSVGVGESYSSYDMKDMLGYMGTAMTQALDHLWNKLRIEAEYAHQMEDVMDSFAFRYVSKFLDAKPYASYLSYVGTTMLKCCKIIQDKYGLDAGQMSDVMRILPSHKYFLPQPIPATPDVTVPIPAKIDFCPYPKEYYCDTHAKYRTIDGSCNNLKHPIFGRSMLPLARFLPAIYSDGVQEERYSVTGAPLPGPRHVSLSLFPDVNRPSAMNTLLLMTFGQFVDHDMTRTAITKMSKEPLGFGKTEEVKCGRDGCDTHHPGLESCWPIPVPAYDPDFSHLRCLKFVRSLEVPNLDCKFTHREQLNQVTPFLDGSQIYGSTKEELEKLRDFLDNPDHGMMKMMRHPHGDRFKPLLPPDEVDLCREINSTVKCFLAGDERVNEQASLTSMHTIWARQHNRVESGLYKLNPHWDPDKLFHEARRIIGAQFQHIVFNEYLPIILGDNIMSQYGLHLVKHGYYHGYDEETDPRVRNSFAAAAYRFGHTLIQDRLRRADYNFHYDDSLMLSSAFRRPAPVYDTARGGLDSIVRGLCEFESQTYDKHITKQVTRSLFAEMPPHGPGMDLMSLNIMRGRDHGLPGYNAYREWCGLGKAYSFDDLIIDIPDLEQIERFKHLYAHVDDIDLWSGGISEKSIEGGILGPTFACIIGRQFQIARKGDRYWYENDGYAKFTAGQLKEIKRSRLARILCANGDYIDKIQPWVLLRPFREAFEDVRKQYDHNGQGGQTGEHHTNWFKHTEFLNNYDKTKTGIPVEKFVELYSSNFNAHVYCKDLPEIDLSLWEDTDDY